MGIKIDHDHKYTKREREYLETHGWAYKVKENDRRFPDPVDDDEEPSANPPDDHSVEPVKGNEDDGNPEPPLSIDEDITEYVASFKNMDDLKEELDEREAEYPKDAHRPELERILAEDMQIERNGEPDE